MIKEASLVAGTACFMALFFAPSIAQTEAELEPVPVAAEPVKDHRTRLEKEREKYELWAAASKDTGDRRDAPEVEDEGSGEETDHYEPTKKPYVAPTPQAKERAEVAALPKGKPYYGEIAILD
ncbi:hypothetical protein [Parasphingorhabdus halotolerans]|uniref:Uncharacterized protein n=1 Tax=Parasphingorhabdus halotolerans TaxID=2725558 RepID=A0A6H2DJS1_9SPHN|nr:hypothetical protein [Parasphingorhabdus halotolerans]QJB67906.1 hypothetical protein HF685_00095 [Parasphingorhabdus halotolerans]